MRKTLAAAGMVGVLTFGSAPVVGATVDAPPPEVAPTSETTSSSDSGGSGAWGLLGLVGLAGLLGLRRGRSARADDPAGRRSFGEAMTSSTVS